MLASNRYLGGYKVRSRILVWIAFLWDFFSKDTRHQMMTRDAYLGEDGNLTVVVLLWTSDLVGKRVPMVRLKQVAIGFIVLVFLLIGHILFGLHRAEQTLYKHSVPLHVEEKSLLASLLSDKSRLKPDNDLSDSCLFRSSTLYRKIYVYPNYQSDHWKGSILSQAGRENRSLPWTWLQIDQKARQQGQAHYDIDGQHGQYATELIIRDLLTHPKSCLRTYNPDDASLFFVPYLSSTEYHAGNRFVNDVDHHATNSSFGNAIRQILDFENYREWENVWGLSSRYWRQRRGVDHILVFSEPLQGLWHDGNQRGNYQYIHTQKQLSRPIIVSIEQSASFVRQFPRCAAKNILLPYPNPDGRWYNGYFKNRTRQSVKERNITVSNSTAALPAEKILATANGDAWSAARPVSYFYYALPHGSCTWLRKALMWNFMHCSKAAKFFSKLAKLFKFDYRYNMHMSTFCPCPAGDSPSAKRMFDSILAGCIPVILSKDFVWPLSTEWDTSSSSSTLILNPFDFSLRFNSQDYGDKLSVGSCLPRTTLGHQNDPKPSSMDVTLEQIDATEIARLRKGLQTVQETYFWYQLEDHSLPDNILQQGILPNGGLAHAFVRALEERVGGLKWQECEAELKQTNIRERVVINQFQC